MTWCWYIGVQNLDDGDEDGDGEGDGEKEAKEKEMEKEQSDWEKEVKTKKEEDVIGVLVSSSTLSTATVNISPPFSLVTSTHLTTTSRSRAEIITAAAVVSASPRYSVSKQKFGSSPSSPSSF